MLLELHMMTGYWSCFTVVQVHAGALCSLIDGCDDVHGTQTMRVQGVSDLLQSHPILSVMLVQSFC